MAWSAISIELHTHFYSELTRQLSAYVVPIFKENRKQILIQYPTHIHAILSLQTSSQSQYISIWLTHARSIDYRLNLGESLPSATTNPSLDNLKLANLCKNKASEKLNTPSPMALVIARES